LHFSGVARAAKLNRENSAEKMASNGQENGKVRKISRQGRQGKEEGIKPRITRICANEELNY
jgi:hypothetical protein